MNEKAEAEDASANWVETPCELVWVNVETTQPRGRQRN